jgi:hypothetical protein
MKKITVCVGTCEIDGKRYEVWGGEKADLEKIQKDRGGKGQLTESTYYTLLIEQG